MEIAATRTIQVIEGRDGRTFEISSAAGDIAMQLLEIDPRLRVAYGERDEKFTIFTRDDTGDHLVMQVPAAEWDQRVIKYLEPRAYEVRNGISIGKRLDEQDAKRKRELDRIIEEAAGEKAYSLMRAFQKLEGINPRSFRKVVKT